MATDAAPVKAFIVMVGVAVLASLVSLAIVKSRRATPQQNAMQGFDIQHDSLAQTNSHRGETEGENRPGDVVGYCCLCMNGWYAVSGRGDCKKHCFSVAFWNANNLGRGGCKAKYKVTGDSGSDVTKKCHAMRTKDGNGKLTPGEREPMKLQPDAKDCASLTNEDAPELGSESSDDEVNDTSEPESEPEPQDNDASSTTTNTTEPESEPETIVADTVVQEDEPDDGPDELEEESGPENDDGDDANQKNILQGHWRHDTFDYGRSVHHIEFRAFRQRS